MSGTLVPPPPTVGPSDGPHPELEAPPKPWWRQTWVLVVAAVALFVGALAVYGAIRESERDQAVSDLEEAGLSESDAEQVLSDFEEGVEDFRGVTTPNDGSLSASEVEAVRAGYSAMRDAEVGGLMTQPPESTFTDEQIRTWTTEACEIVADSESAAEVRARVGNTFADEPYPEVAGFFGPVGAAFACQDMANSLGLYDQ